MRNKTIIKLKDENKEAVELIYYDGVKLEAVMQDNTILAWYDYANDHEKWFIIKVFFSLNLLFYSIQQSFRHL